MLPHIILALNTSALNPCTANLCLGWNLCAICNQKDDKGWGGGELLVYLCRSSLYLTQSNLASMGIKFIHCTIKFKWKFSKETSKNNMWECKKMLREIQNVFKLFTIVYITQYFITKDSHFFYWTCHLFYLTLATFFDII